MDPEIEAAVIKATAVINTLSTTLAVTTATSSSTASPNGSISASIQSDGQGDCELLGPFALLVQLALGGLALLSLVYKRWRERPQRPLKIWFFDVSKQVFGSVLVHGANVFMSMLTSGEFTVNEMEAVAATPTTGTARLLKRVAGGGDDGYVPNPCSWYLLNLAIDTTLGIPILILLLRIITGLVAYTPLGKPYESIQSGNYGNPPNKWWWLKQSVIYFLGLFGMKICVLILFLLMPWISRIGDWALRWTEGNEKLQIAFVMMIFPLIMNGLQYYIIDSFIKMKSQDDHEHERLPSQDPDDDHHRRGSMDTDLDGVLSDDEETGLAPAREVKAIKSPVSPRDEEYDPEVDGEARTIAGSGSSSRAGTKDSSGKVLRPTPDLYPKE